MDDERLSRRLGESLRPLDQLIRIRMSGEAIDLADIEIDVEFQSHHMHPLLSFQDISSERSFGLISYEQQGVPLVVQSVPQMMGDPAGSAHAVAGHDDARLIIGIEFHGILDARRIFQIGVVEERISEIPQRIGIIAFLVLLEDLRRLHGQRAIEEYLLQRELLLVDERIEEIQQLLRPFDGERGNEEFASFLERLRSVSEQELFLASGILMEPVAVGGFDEHIIGIGYECRILGDRRASLPDIAGEDDLGLSVSLCDEEFYGSRTEDMSRILEPDSDVVGEFQHLRIFQGLEGWQACCYVIHGIQRLSRREMLSRSSPILVLDIPLLDLGAVFQEDLDQVLGG